ncbi:hypothetical protein LSCM4_08277 [Leishmania orientalis]|uniref:non-specific serine/threonine protein kinase n=1 Tax=Leishmania orientalis TaxID=2249476 RepID=A0A836GTU7_9TRYP|nr:hypothetical protein LSCM4_08277 [Leishmania orientalis]
MLRWATQTFGKLSTGAVAAADASKVDAGEAAAHRQQRLHTRSGADLPPLKRWWSSTDAEDASAGAARPSSPASLTSPGASMDDGYCSPGVLDLAASLSFATLDPAAAAPAVEVIHTGDGNLPSASAAHARNDVDAVDDFLQSVIAGKTDLLRKQLAQEKLEAAAAVARAAASHGSNNSPTRTRGSGAGLDSSTSRNSMSMAGTLTGDGAASTGSNMHLSKSSWNAAMVAGSPRADGAATAGPKGIKVAVTATAGAASDAGGASQEQRQHHARRDRYVSSAARSLQDYELIAFLGSGTFAEVTLARNKVTGEYFAVKKISKQRVKEEGCVERTFTERQLLAKLHHPFLVRLYQAFQSQTHLYLVLDFAQGGDLYYLNVQQLWLRSMKRSLIKMQYPYYQSTSSTFTPVLTPTVSLPLGTNAAAATTASHAQPQHPSASPSSPIPARAGIAHLMTGPALPPLSPSPAAPPLAEATLDAQLQPPGGSSATATTERDAFLVSSSVAEDAGDNTVSEASRSCITTVAALPRPSAQDGHSSNLTDGADEDDMEGKSTDTTELDGGTDINFSMTEAPPSLVVWRQQKSRPRQQGGADHPSRNPRLPTDLTYYTTDAVDEFATSSNTGKNDAAALDTLASESGESRSSALAFITPRTPESAGTAAATTTAAARESTTAAAREGEAASSAAPVASSGRERQRLRRRTLPTAERGGDASDVRSSRSSSSSADDIGKGRGQRDATAGVRRGRSAETSLQPSQKQRAAAHRSSAAQAAAAAQPPPSSAIPAYRCRSTPGAIRGASFAERGSGSGGAGKPLQNGKPPLTVSVKPIPSRVEAKRKQPCRASLSEVEDVFAAAASLSASTVTGTRAAKSKRRKELSESVSPSTAVAEQREQLASGNSHTATRTTGVAATSLQNVRERKKTPSPGEAKAKARIGRGKGEGDGTSTSSPPPLRTCRSRQSRRAPEKKAVMSHEASEAATERRSFSTDITDAAKLSSASVTAASFAGVTAAQCAAATAAALRVDLAAPFHQVAMEGSTSALRTLLSEVFAPDGEHRFPLRLIAFYAIEVALVLQYLHGEGFLYRDLKPENILMRGDGHVMLTDFGVAKYRKGAAIVPSARGDGVKGEDAGSLSSPGAGADGRANSFTGTTQYMSPEMLRGQPHDSRTDWWSYGCLLFEWANGRKAFDAQNQFALFRSIVEEDVKITAEDYRLTPLEVHARVAQLHYRAEEVRLEFEDRVARRLRQNFASSSQSSRPPAATSTLTAEVVYDADTRSFEVRLRSSVAEGREEALASDALSSCAPHQQSSCDHSPPPLQSSDSATTNPTPRQRGQRLVHSHDSASPRSTTAAATPSAAVLLNDSFASDLSALNPPRSASAEGDTQGLPPQSALNDSFAIDSFAGIGSNSVLSFRGAPGNLSMRLTTAEGGAIAALLSSASQTALHLQQQDEQQERRLRHQRRRLRLSCLALDEATRDRYISSAVAQMDEAQVLLRDLTVKLLDRRVEHRLSGEAVLDHPFFTCPYVVSQLYYEVYQRRVLSAEMRRSVRATFDSNTSLANPAASVPDAPLQQAASQSLSQGPTSAAAAAAPSIRGSCEAIPLPSQTRPEDWRELFMERRIRAPYTPRLRTRDDLRYFPAAVTATGLSAAAEQHRRIKEVKEQQKELMMMRASKAAAAPTGGSFSAASLAASLPGPHAQLLVSGSGSGSGGPVVLVPLDTEAAQHVQQLLVAGSRSPSMCYNDGVESALGASHVTAAPVALTSPGAGGAVATADEQSVVSTPAASSQGEAEKPQQLQVTSVEVMEAASGPLRDALPSPKRPANVSVQRSAARVARGADAAEDTLLDSPLRMPQSLLQRHSGGGGVALVESGGKTAAAATAQSVKTPLLVSLAPKTTDMTVTESAEEATPPPNAVGAAAAAGECRSDLFGRAATLPQSFVDAALAVAAAAQKRQLLRSSGSVIASTAAITASGEARRGSSDVMAAAAAEPSSISASIDVRRSLSTNRSTLETVSPTSLVAPPLEEEQQQQAARADDATLNCPAPSESRKMACAATAADFNDDADRQRRNPPSACYGEEGHAELAEDEAEDEGHDGGGGYYEQDAFAEDDDHGVDVGDDATALEEAAGTVDMATSSNSATAAVMASTIDTSSCDDSHVSARPLTLSQQGTSLSPSVMLNSISMSGWRGGAPVPLCPSGGADDEVGKCNDSGREDASATDPLSNGPVEPPLVVTISPTLPSRSRPPLGGSATHPIHGFPKETPALTSPLHEPTTPLSHSGEMRCDLSAFATSSASSLLTLPFDDSQRSLSPSLGTSGAGGPRTNSSTWATSSPADTPVPVREHQRRVHHHHHHQHPLSYPDTSEKCDASDAAPRVLSLPPSLALGEQKQRQSPQNPLPSVAPAESPPLPGTNSSPGYATTIRLVTGMMRLAELTGVGGSPGIATVAAHTTIDAVVSAEVAEELAAVRVGSTSVGGVGVPLGSSCHVELHSADAACSDSLKMPAPFPDLEDRREQSPSPSAAAVTGSGSIDITHDAADDNNDNEVADEAGYKISGGEDHSSSDGDDGNMAATTGSSSERGDEGESESDASGSCDSASRPATPTPVSTYGRDGAGDARSADAELPLLGSSPSSISTATSTSVHAFSSSSGTSSTDSKDDSDTAAPAGASAAAMRHTLPRSPMIMLPGFHRSSAAGLFETFGLRQDCSEATSPSPCDTTLSFDAGAADRGAGRSSRRHSNDRLMAHRYAHLGRDAGHGGVSRRVPLAAHSTLYGKLAANAPPPPPLDSSSGLLSNPFTSSASLDTIDGGTAELFGPLTTTLSGVAYRVDDEASVSTLAEAPIMMMTGSSDRESVSTSMPRSHRGRGQGGKDAGGDNTCGSSGGGSSGGGPTGMSDRRGVQALWAQQQRKRIERGLQQRQSKQAGSLEGASTRYVADAESRRGCIRERERRSSYGATHMSSCAASPSTGKMASGAFDDGAEQSSVGRHDDTDSFGAFGRAEPRQRSHGAPKQPSPQRQSVSLQGGAEPSRGDDRSVDRGQRNSLWSNCDNEGGAEGRVRAISDGSIGGGGGGFDHFQNFSFTSPQILQQYLASSSGGKVSGEGGRPPPYQRSRRDRLDGGAHRNP